MMEVELMGSDRDERTLLAIGDPGCMMQEDNLGGTIVVDSRNGFKKLIHLYMLWNVPHCWTVEARFTWNWNKN